MKQITRSLFPVYAPTAPAVAISIASAILLSSTHSALADTDMLMPVTPALSPDGSQVVFSWENDLWSVSTNTKSDSYAQRLTTHPGREYNPFFSPDGKTIYFNSNREGKDQVFSMPLDRSSPTTQVTFHSESNLLEDISADGDYIIYRSLRDKAGRSPYRIFQSAISADEPEEMLFDADAKYAKVSPDGNKVLITREGSTPYRVGYHGTQSSQIWIYDKSTRKFTQPVKDKYGCLNPLWLPDGSGFYYLSGKSGSFNLYQHDLASAEDTQLTNHKDANVMFPMISRDGNKIIYRKLFHYYVFNTKTGKSKKLKLKHNLELQPDPVRDSVVKKTEDIDFSPSGLEITFTANGNIFAMDTVLREPVQLTHTPAHESNLFFGDKGKAIYYILDNGIETTIEKLTKKDSTKYWWEENELESRTVISVDNTVIESFIPSPDGKLIGYTTSRGNFFVYDLKNKTSTRMAQSWSSPSFNWSPDSKWVTYSLSDDNFNNDIFITPIDGSQDPVNVTKHPDNEYSPSFSPDGKKLSFIGKRHSSSYDLYYVDLTPQGSEKSARDKKLESAKKAMQKDPGYKSTASKIKNAIKKLTGTTSKTDEKKNSKKDASSEPTNVDPEENSKKLPKKEETKQKKPKEDSKDKKTEKPKSELKDKKKDKVKDENKYDLVNIQKRIKHISLKGVSHGNIYWKSDSKAILVENKTAKATMAYDIKTRKGNKVMDFTGMPLRYDKSGNLFYLAKSVPGIVKKGKLTSYTFSAQTTFNKTEHQRHKYRLIWRTIRDGFYDEQLNGKDWEKVRTKYEKAATLAQSSSSFDRIINTMLGELNASHMGYRSSSSASWQKRSAWREEILHLGIDYEAKNDGWHITNILTNSPATGKLSKLHIGEVITHINDIKVTDKTIQKDVLWGQLKDQLQLKVNSIDGKQRAVKLSPISYSTARRLANNDRIEDNKSMVEKLSKGKLGYLHIAKMAWEDFTKFEQHLYENGAGKDGLIIDVRDNSGGFTTDHLLTALTQPRHAYTIPRNGGIGYPQDRSVYATWKKPIVVLCNQNSFSNAEIFAHAIKTLKRGKIVGVPTAGGVISTGSRSILGEGSLRMPFRGWFLSGSGEDMELHGASPSPRNIIWTKPGEIEQGIDKQIKRAVQVLKREVRTKSEKTVVPTYRSR